MTCDSVSKLIPLYFYGELTPDEEDHVEQHVHGCSNCAASLDRQRALGVALDRRQIDAPPILLENCRSDLMAAIQGGAPRANKAKGPWALFLEAMAATFSGFSRYRQPVGALALVLIGFFAARLTSTPGPTSPSSPSQANPNSEDVLSTIRSIQPDAGGKVQIAFDETRRRTVSGTPDNPNIQKLLLAAAHEENPAVRVESVGLLKDRCASSNEIRDILLNALMHDSNDGVRLRAIQGLKPLSSDTQVRQALSNVLLMDPNPAVRMQAVDMLVTHHDGSMVGVLQDVVQKEDNDAIRQKLEKALKDMNASVGTF